MTAIVRLLSAWTTTIVALTVIAGWMFDVGPLKTVLAGFTTMKANTALGLAAGGIAVLAFDRSALVKGLCVVVIAGIGALTLAEYATGVNIGIDEALFPDPLTTSSPFNGRMSPATAFSFLTLAVSLALMSRRASERAMSIAHALALVPLFVGALAIAGYSYEGRERLYNFGPYVSVALHTAICLVLIAVAVLSTRPSGGWARPFDGRPIARGALRRLIALALLMPFVMGFLVHLGVESGFYQAAFTPVLFATGSALTFLVIAVTSARTIAFAEATIATTRAQVVVRDRQIEFSERRYTTVVEGLPQLVWTCLPDGNCDYLSPQWVRYTGLSEAEQLGFGWLTSVLHPDDRERTYEHWRGAVEGLHPYDIEYRIRGVDGTYRLFKTRGMPIRDASGKIVYWFGSCTDIQDIDDARTIVARSKVDLEARVAAQTEELKAREEQLRQSQKMEAVGQLTGGLAHDFNNLLAGISGSLEMMQIRLDQGRVSDLDRYMTAAQGAARRAAALTHRLLAFSRRQTLDPKPTDVNRLVSGMEELIRRTVGPAIDLEVVGAGGLWLALVDPPQLENALLNLCINARDAMPEGGRITIETANKWLDERAARVRDLAPGQYLSLCVTDTGTGMTPDVVAKAFDPFFTTKPIGMGTGLGLSMIYGFARQSGGQVRIYTEVNQGSTLCIYLPRHHGVAEDSDAAIDVAIPSPSQGGRTILVVDDEPSVRMLVTEILDQLGYMPIEAADSVSGLKILQSDVPIDLLVTDVGLPGGMNGRQMADAARSVRPNLKVLFITGYAENAAVGNGHLEPGMQVMTKPFALEALAARIKMLVAP